MGLFRCDIYSEELDKNTSFYISTPKPKTKNERFDRSKKLQVLYLLHGGGDDFTKWVRRVPIERITREYKIAVVMPDASLSYYTNIPGMGNYFSYIACELPKIVQTYFPVSDKREDNFIAGLSMGGYGACSVAFTYPEKFKAVGSFSGALEISKMDSLVRPKGSPDNRLRDVDLSDSDFCSDKDIFEKIKLLINEKKAIPSFYQSCGTEDFIYPVNESVRQKILGLPQKIDYKYEEWSGNHDWDFWEESLKHALKWFGFKKDYVRG